MTEGSSKALGFKEEPKRESVSEHESQETTIVPVWAIQMLGGEVVEEKLPIQRGKTGGETFKMFFARRGGGLLPKDAKEPGEGYEWVVNSHTWDVMNGAVKIAGWLKEQGQEVDMKVLLTACLLHDVGKGFYLRATRGVGWNKAWTESRPGLKDKLDAIGHAGFSALLLNAATKNNPDADQAFVRKVKEVILAHDQVVPTTYGPGGKVISPAAPNSLEARILLWADHATGEFDEKTGTWKTTDDRLKAICTRWVERDHVITPEEFGEYEQLVGENHRYLFQELLRGKHQVNEIPLKPVEAVRQVMRQVEETLGVIIPPASHWK